QPPRARQPRRQRARRRQRRRRRRPSRPRPRPPTPWQPPVRLPPKRRLRPQGHARWGEGRIRFSSGSRAKKRTESPPGPLPPLVHPIAGFHPEPPQNPALPSQQLLAAADIAALDSIPAQPLEAARQLRVVSNLPVDFDPAGEVILGRPPLVGSSGVVEQSLGV